MVNQRKSGIFLFIILIVIMKNNIMSTKCGSGDVHYAGNNNDVKEAINRVTNAESLL